MLFGVDLPTEPAAVEILREIEAQHGQTFKLRRFQSGRTFFHSKISIFSRKAGTTAALIGSSNLTEGGLSTNYETNVLLDDRRVLRRFIDYFDEHFEGAHARSVDNKWLDQYKRLWSERQKVERRQRELRNKARKLGKKFTFPTH